MDLIFEDGRRFTEQQIRAAVITRGLGSGNTFKLVVEDNRFKGIELGKCFIPAEDLGL